MVHMYVCIMQYVFGKNNMHKNTQLLEKWVLTLG